MVREGEKGAKVGLGRGRGRPRNIRSGEKLNLGEKKEGIKRRRGNKGRGNMGRKEIKGNCAELKEETNIGETENIKDDNAAAVEGIVIDPDEGIEENKSSDTDSNTEAELNNRRIDESAGQVIITSQEIDTVETVDSLGKKDKASVRDTDIIIEEMKTEVRTRGAVTPTTLVTSGVTVRERSRRIINRESRGEAMLKGNNSETSTTTADNIPHKGTKTKSVIKTSVESVVETAEVTTETPTKVVETFKEIKLGFSEKTTKDVETLLMKTKTEIVSEPDSNIVEETKEMEEKNLEIETTDEKNIELRGTSSGEMSRDETKIDLENEVKEEKKEETEGGEQRRRLRKSRTPVKKK